MMKPAEGWSIHYNPWKEFCELFKDENVILMNNTLNHEIIRLRLAAAPNWAVTPAFAANKTLFLVVFGEK
jgi:hypothetical protein